MAYTSLFKQSDVRVTTAFSSTHKGIDLSRGVVEQPIYLPNKAIEGYVWKILPGYPYGGKYYADSPIIYIKHKDGSGSRYIHSYPRNVKVKVGDTIQAGSQVCATGNSGYSFGDHLHFEWLTKWDDLNTRVDPAPHVIDDNLIFKIGDRVEFTAVQNIRQGSGTTYPITGQTSVGQLGVIKDGVRVANGYRWYDIQFGGGGTGWVADVGKFKIAEPVSPCQEYTDRVLFLEGTLALREKELKELEEDYARIQGERDNFEKQYQDAVTELNSLKEQSSVIDKIKELLAKLFRGE